MTAAERLDAATAAWHAVRATGTWAQRIAARRELSRAVHAARAERATGSVTS